MSRFFERLLCSFMLTVGTTLVLDSRGVTLSTEGVIGIATCAAALGFLLLPESEA